MLQPQAVIFDIGNVLTRWQPEAFYDRVIGPDRRQALFAEVDRDWAGLDILCANAGIKGPTAGIEDMDLTEWRACLAVNLDGALIAAKHAARRMKPAGAGVMIFTSSTSGLYGTPFRAP